MVSVRRHPLHLLLLALVTFHGASIAAAGFGGGSLGFWGAFVSFFAIFVIAVGLCYGGRNKSMQVALSGGAILAMVALCSAVADAVPFSPWVFLGMHVEYVGILLLAIGSIGVISNRPNSNGGCVSVASWTYYLLASLGIIAALMFTVPFVYQVLSRTRG